MNELTEPLYSSVHPGSATRFYPSRDPHGLSVTKFQFALFSYACAGLIAAHLLVIAFDPRYSDSFTYSIWALALLTYGSIALMQARSTDGVLSSRWLFFALSLGATSLNYMGVAGALVFNINFSRCGAALLAASTTLLVVALTQPAESRSRGERGLNAMLAMAFFCLRFMVELILKSDGTTSSREIFHYTFDPLAILALSAAALFASSRNKRSFYKSVTLYLGADFLAGFCVNQIAYLWLHKQGADPWSLTATVVPLACGVYLLGNLTTTHAQSRIQFRESARPVVSALVPFAMNALIVGLSVLLLPTHRYLAESGFVFAIVTLFARIAFNARSQSSVEQSLRYALRNQSWQDGPDPLSKVESERDFGPALWQARDSVGRETPLSLLFVEVEEAAEILDVADSRLEGDYLIEVARHLCQWRPTYAKLYYLGQSRFAMLLPATSSRSARSLASQICTGIDALGLMGRRGAVRLSVGSATALVLADASRLVEAASQNISSQRRRLFGLFPPRSGQIAFPEQDASAEL